MSTASQAPGQAGWQRLFWDAFRQSRNPMVLLDNHRRIVEINGPLLRLLGYERRLLIGRPVYELRVDGPPASNHEWRNALAKHQFTGIADFRRADGSRIRVEFAGHPEVVTGQQLVLAVILHASRSRSLHAVTPPPTTDAPPLSRRELEVTRLIALGLSGPEIANELHLAHNTVRTHVRNAMTKTGSRSRAHLVAIMLANTQSWPKAA